VPPDHVFSGVAKDASAEKGRFAVGAPFSFFTHRSTVHGRDAMELSDWHMWWKERGGNGVRRLLMARWDPIGVQDMPEAADEYDSYVGVVGRMLREGAAAEQIRVYLADIRENYMGLGPSTGGAERDQAVAAQLVEWYAREMRPEPCRD
jgi:hypothetical protein